MLCASSIFLSSSGSDAFQPLSLAVSRTSTRSSFLLRSSRPDLQEFDFILGEGNSQSQNDFNQQTVVRSRRQIKLPGGGRPGERATILASSTFAAPGIEEDVAQEQEADPYADLLEESPILHKYEKQEVGFVEGAKNNLKAMDLQDIISTLIVPSIFAGAALKWGFGRVSERVSAKAEATLESFASDMVYHDGDFEEMKLCSKDFGKKLVWLGPHKNTIMLKRYLQLYAKKKTVSPQSISSLSYVFSLYKLSEEKAAQVLVSLCRDMGDKKLSSAGKLLFFGSRILKSPEGKAALDPIRELIKGSYREIEVAETMVETSQQAIGEAAYRSAIQAGGKDQDSNVLTVGWEVLGVDKDTATRIFLEEKRDGFISDREKMYRGQSTKYDDKGNRIKDDGDLEDPENAIVGDEKKPTSNVMGCTECGYTLFIAKGREAKFFGDGFSCPDCGALKDKFEAKDIDED